MTSESTCTCLYGKVLDVQDKLSATYRPWALGGTQEVFHSPRSMMGTTFGTRVQVPDKISRSRSRSLPERADATSPDAD